MFDEGADLQLVRVLGVNDDTVDRGGGEDQLSRRGLRRPGGDDAAVLQPVRRPVRPRHRDRRHRRRLQQVDRQHLRGAGRAARWVLPGSVPQRREPDRRFQFSLSVELRKRSVAQFRTEAAPFRSLPEPPLDREPSRRVEPRRRARKQHMDPPPVAATWAIAWATTMGGTITRKDTVD